MTNKIVLIFVSILITSCYADDSFLKNGDFFPLELYADSNIQNYKTFPLCSNIEHSAVEELLLKNLSYLNDTYTKDYTFDYYRFIGNKIYQKYKILHKDFLELEDYFYVLSRNQLKPIIETRDFLKVNNFTSKNVFENHILNVIQKNVPVWYGFAQKEYEGGYLEFLKFKFKKDDSFVSVVCKLKGDVLDIYVEYSKTEKQTYYIIYTIYSKKLMIETISKQKGQLPKTTKKTP